MKLFKKLAAALVATMLVMTMIGTSAFAATVTVDSGTEPVKLSEHTFKAYQIFKGTQGANSMLTNIEWGADIDAAGFTTELTAKLKDKGFSGTTTAEAVAEALAKYTTSDPDKVAEQVAQIAYKHINKASGTSIVAGNNPGVEAGYYLIVDTTPNMDGKDDAANAALLQVTDKITIAVKTDKPKVEKKVIENVKHAQRDSGTMTYKSGTEDRNDYLVEHENDTADYNIGDDVPFKLHSVIPDMSHYVGDYKYIFHDTMAESLDYVNNSVVVSVNGKPVATTKYSVDYNSHKLTITFGNLKDVGKAGEMLTVEFKATLNKNAKIGQETFASGTGNVNKVYLEYSNQPNGEGSGTGKTPEEKVIVFTYKLDVNKVDPSGTLLNGAKFKFYKKSGTEDAYVKVDTDGKVDGWFTNSGSATEFESKSGTFGIVGLDDGTYYLVETKAPENYNKLPGEIEVIITADTTNGQNGNAAVTELKDVFVKANGESGVTSSGTDKALSIEVENKQGTVLPSTGGIGTTIFYVLGAILVLGGGVLLVTRRRMAA